MKHRDNKILEYKKELAETFAKACVDKYLMSAFLTDILTPTEFEALALRWQIVKKLHQGETHRAIAEDLGLGISTVTRGAREFRNKKGGFHLMLKKITK